MEQTKTAFTLLCLFLVLQGGHSQQMTLTLNASSIDCLVANKETYQLIGTADVSVSSPRTLTFEFRIAETLINECKLDMRRISCTPQVGPKCYCAAFDNNIYTVVYEDTAMLSMSQAVVTLVWRDTSRNVFYSPTLSVPLVKEFVCKSLKLAYVPVATNQSCLLSGADDFTFSGTLDVTGSKIDNSTQRVDVAVKTIGTDTFNSICSIDLITNGCSSTTTSTCYCKTYDNSIYTIIYTGKSTTDLTRATVHLVWKDNQQILQYSSDVNFPPIKDYTCDALYLQPVSVVAGTFYLSGTVDISDKDSVTWPRKIDFEIKLSGSSAYDAACRVDIGKDGCPTTSSASCTCDTFQNGVYTIRYQDEALSKYSYASARLAWSDKFYISIYSVPQSFPYIKETIPPQLSLEPKSVSDDCLLANKDTFAFLGQVDVTKANSETSYVDFDVKYAGGRTFKTDCRVDMKRSACFDQQSSLCYCQSFQNNVYTFVYNETATTPFSRADVRLTWRDNSPTPFFTSSQQLPLIKDKCQILAVSYLSQTTNQQCLITGADSLQYRGTLDATDYIVDATSQTLQFQMKYYDSDIYETLCMVNLLSDGCSTPSTKSCYCERLMDNVYTVVYQQQATPTCSKAQVRLAWTDSLGRNKVSDVIVNPSIKDISCDVINMYPVTVAEEVITIIGTVDVTGRDAYLWPRIINFELKQEFSDTFETFCTVDIGQDGCQATSPTQCFCEKFQADVYTVRYQSAASAKFSNGQVRLAWSDTSYNTIFSVSQTFSDVKEIISPIMSLEASFDNNECIVADRDVFTFIGDMDVTDTNTASQTVHFEVKYAGSDYFVPVCSMDMASTECTDQPDVMCHCQSYENNVYSFVFTGVASTVYSHGEVRLAWQGVSSAIHYSPSSHFPEIKELKCHDLTLQYQAAADSDAQCLVADSDNFMYVGTLDISGSSIDNTTQTVNFQFKLAGAEDFQTMCSVDLITDQCPSVTDKACLCTGFDNNIYNLVYSGTATTDMSQADVRLEWQDYTDTKYSSSVTFPVVKVGHCDPLEITYLSVIPDSNFNMEGFADVTDKDENEWPRIFSFQIREWGYDDFQTTCIVDVQNEGCPSPPGYDCYCDRFEGNVYYLYYNAYPLSTYSEAPARLAWSDNSSNVIYSKELNFPYFENSGCDKLISLNAFIVTAVGIVVFYI